METIIEFITPLSAIFPVKNTEEGNILPQDYRDFYIRKKVIEYCTAIFLILSSVGFGYTWMKISETLSLKERIGSLRSEIKVMKPVYDNYSIRYKEFQDLFPLINIINTTGSAPDFQRALIIMEQLRIKNVNIHSIQINNEKGESLSLNIKGIIISEGFTDMQNNYQTLLNTIKKNKGIELLSDRVDLKDKSFQIEARYRDNRIL
ncbi:MAG: hypothetical protein HY754_10765 [Nitrospirae bacterium]|nr:hypothetical protein [Nitrospirota bacterium]